MLKKSLAKGYEELSIDSKTGFLCIIINGESFAINEEEYSRILKDTYNYIPELYESEYGYMDY